MKDKVLGQSQGQAVVVIALMMIGMIAMLGLVFDGGNVYLQRRRMQNAADAASLAGGRQLALARSAGNANEYPIQQAINNYVTYNGASPASMTAFYINSTGGTIGQVGVSGIIPTQASGLRVTASTAFNTYFLGVVNINTGNASALATIQTGQPKGGANLFPVAVPTGTLTTGTPPPGDCQYNLANPPACQIWGENTGPGSSGWTNFKVCGSGGSNYLAEVLNGSRTSGSVQIGDSICTETGSIAQLGNELLPWVGKNVVIPIYDCTNAETSCPNYESQHNGTNLKYHVAAFASFKFTGFYVSASGSGSGGNLSCFPTTSKFLCGQFQRWATSTDVDPTKTCTYGFCGFEMTE